MGRPISVSVVPAGPGMDIWLTCGFLGRCSEVSRDFQVAWGGRNTLCLQVLIIVGFGTLVGETWPWTLLSSRETAAEPFLDTLTSLELACWYCSAAFARQLPTWRLPAPWQWWRQKEISTAKKKPTSFWFIQVMFLGVRIHFVGRLRTPEGPQHFPEPKRLCPGPDFSIHASEEGVRLGIG